MDKHRFPPATIETVIAEITHAADAGGANEARCLQWVSDLTALRAKGREGGAGAQAGLKRWPFVESPGEFTERLAAAMQEFPLLGAVRHVLIENPPTLSQQPAARMRSDIAGYREATVLAHVECRECRACGHIGINDSAAGKAGCHECDWFGAEPDADRCPRCDRTDCIGAACPKCGDLYLLLASTDVSTQQPAAPSGEAVAPDRERVVKAAEFRAACYRLLNRVEGAGCERWESNGVRLKDTQEWVQFDLAVKEMQRLGGPDPYAAPQQAAAPEEMAQDAARYRWLRENALSVCWQSGRCNSGWTDYHPASSVQFDTAVDNAMLGAHQHGGA